MTEKDTGKTVPHTGPAREGTPGATEETEAAEENRPGEDEASPDARSDQGALETMLDVVHHDDKKGDAFLVALSGSNPGRLFLLDGTEYLIGRSQSADISIGDKAASQRHAKLVWRGERYLVEDLGSTNGTYVNDERVHDEVPLRIGDVIRIGETLFTYLDEQGAGEASRTIPIRVGSSAATRFVPGQAMARAAPAPVAEHSEGESSLRELIEKALVVIDFLRRHRGWILGLGLAGLVAGIALYVMLPTPKMAHFAVSLKPDLKRNPVDRTRTRQQQGEEGFFSSAGRDFKDPKLIRSALSKLGEEDPPSSRVKSIRKNLEFSLMSRNDHVYEGTYVTNDADWGKRFLETYMPMFLKYEIDKALKTFQAEVDFLSQQLDEAEKELLNTEGRLLEFRNKNLDGLPEQAQERFSSKFELSAQQRQLSTRLEQINLELQNARNKLASEDHLVSRKVEQAKPYRESLLKVQQQISEAKSRGLGDDHPELEKLRSQKRDLERMSQEVLESRSTDLERRANAEQQALRDKIRDLEVERRVTQKQLNQVSGNLNETKQIIEKLPEVEVTNQQLNRSYEAKKALHSKLFEQLKASQLQLELERNSAQARYDIVQPPAVRYASTFKLVVMRVALPTVAGLFLAICIGLILDLRRYIKENFGPDPIRVRSS